MPTRVCRAAEAFRRDFALPIERYGNEDAATRLRRISSPFILRRLESDSNVIQDLPPKNEMKVVCTLTSQQATLYKAIVDDELRRIESSGGIERRGRVLRQLGALGAWEGDASPADVLSPLVRAAAQTARRIAMADPGDAGESAALPKTQSAKPRARKNPGDASAAPWRSPAVPQNDASAAIGGL